MKMPATQKGNNNNPPHTLLLAQLRGFAATSEAGDSGSLLMFEEHSLRAHTPFWDTPKEVRNSADMSQQVSVRRISLQ